MISNPDAKSMLSLSTPAEFECENIKTNKMLRGIIVLRANGSD